MKMVALLSGKQRSIHGPAVNIPSKVDTICNILHRLPSQIELVPLKLKRKLVYKGHYMYDYVTPQKLLDALGFLKTNNSLYGNVDVSKKWLQAAMDDDTELCECLLTQQDNNMHEQPSKPTASFVSDFVNSDVTNVLDSHSANLPIYSDASFLNNAFKAARDKLETIASQNSFTIHDVPSDGNCMFHAIAYQLNTRDICDVDSDLLRDMAVDQLRDNKELYCDFVCQPVGQSDSYNADNVPPTQEDMEIDSASDPQLQAELRWLKYLRDVKEGAWGDNIAISDMLSVRITILSSHYPMTSVTPSSGYVAYEVYIGLIMQYHYVGLHKTAQSEPIVAK